MQFTRELINACIQEDRKAQKELYEKCFAPLLSICFRFANNKDDAVVLLNEAFFKILKSLKNQNPEIPFYAWAKRVTLNHCIDQYKKEAAYHSRLTPVDDPSELENTPELQVVSNEEEEGEYSRELLQKVRQEILNLPPTTQEVFQLFVLEGYSHQEIAEILEIREGTSKWHVNNARKMLKEALKKTSKILSSLVL